MAMKRTTVDGKVVNTRTADMLREAENRLGFGLNVVQGSYNRGGVSASAGTHDGGGAIDVSVRGLSSAQIKEVVYRLRQVGFAAWYRSSSEGPWAPHIHAIAIGDPELSSGARSQVSAYYARLSGLASRRSDTGPRLNPIPTWPVKLSPISLGRLIFQYKAKKKRSVPAVKKVQELLNYKNKAGLIVDGIFGPKTVDAYKDWEKKVGAPKADGHPGEYSLDKLIAGWYRRVK